MDRQRSRELADAGLNLCPTMIIGMHAREGHEVTALRRCAYLEKFMDVDACLVHHGDVEWTPVLEEGKIKELVVDGEVVMCSIVVWGGGGAALGT